MTSKKIIYGLLGSLALIVALLFFMLRQEKSTQQTTNQEAKTSQTSSKSNTEAQTTSSTTTAQTESTLQEPSQEAQLTSEVSENSQAASPVEAKNQGQGILPQLVGTWKGTSLQSNDVTMTISADGSIQSVADFGEYGGIQENTVSVSQASPVASNSYRWVITSGDATALLPGVSGIGGAGLKGEFGFIWEGNQLRPVLFLGPFDGDIDYANPQDYGVVLTKQ